MQAQPAPAAPTPPVDGPRTQQFVQRDAPSARITGADVPTDPDATIVVTVVLGTDSVATARARAERTNRTFDADAALHAVERSQAIALPQLLAAGATIDNTVTRVLNAVNLRVTVRNLDALAQVPGVQQVHVARTIERDNGTSNTYTGVPQVWNSTGGAGSGTGDGVSIAVIDDGIDYTHGDFLVPGSVGDPAVYAANDPKVVEVGTFPTAKVIGGYDLVGDRYSSGGSAIACNTVTNLQTTRTPCPDADPLACSDHGTHVSGTAAGYGVLTGGTTYSGGYDTTSLTGKTFTVAPGAAPLASLYMFKVFGCSGGSTDAVILSALDMVGSLPTLPQVLNMSLGSSWGTPDEPIALALDALAQQGVLPVVSAGNNYGKAYLVGGPSTADRALSVAAIAASTTVLCPTLNLIASFSSGGPRSDSAPKPDIAAPGCGVVSASRSTGTGARTMSGTSMASPHAAGVAALVAAAHPMWSPDRLKGALMGTANASRVLKYQTVRAGAGVVNAPSAVNTVATITTTDGTDALAFGVAHVPTTFEATRTFTIENWSGSGLTYDLSSNVNDLNLGAGLSITFNSATVTAPAATGTAPNVVPGTATVQVTVHVSGTSALRSVQEQPEGTLDAINGLIVATPRSSAAGVYPLAVPMVMVPYGVSDISAAGNSRARIDSLAQVPTSLRMINAGSHEGYYDVYQWALTDPADDVPLADQAVAPNIIDVGVSSYLSSNLDQIVLFAVHLKDPFTTMGTNAFLVFINTDGDPAPEWEILCQDDGLLNGSGSPNGKMSAYLYPYGSSTTSIPGISVFAPFNGTIVEIPVRAADLGLTGAFSFSVTADSIVAGTTSDSTGIGYFDPDRPGVSNGDFDVLAAGAALALPVSADLAAAAAQNALGWLVVSVDDATVAVVDRVPLLVPQPVRPSA